MDILLLSGRSRSGKDAVATALVETLGAHSFAIATALKRDVANATGLSFEIFNDVRKDRPINGLTQTPRDLLLAHARIARAADRDVYSSSTCARIEDAMRLHAVDLFVICDWRYKCEADYFATRFPEATLCRVRIVRPGLVPLASLESEVSEHDLDDVRMDIILQNEGTLADLHANAVLAVRKHIEPLARKA